MNFNVNLEFLKFNLKAMNLEYIIYIINCEIVIHIWLNEIKFLVPLLFVLLSVHFICIICIIIYSYFHKSM